MRLDRFTVQWRIRRLLWQHNLRRVMREIQSHNGRKRTLSVRVVKVIGKNMIRIK
ncbi:hypothetical protein KY359_00300 [Candidatus Woesearchaeota archaeon]|nr:hypothetical protein [Candidatus Woesearchaeota archaeon]